MTGTLLLRGMLVGIVAGLLCFAFLKLAGEPSVDRAIAFEGRMEEAREAAPAPPGTEAMHKHDAEPELVSRPVQAGIGLFTGVAVYSASFGGLFALAFALAYGRLGPIGVRATSALLAGAGFVAVYLVPSLKYPANPPSVGEPDTIGMRTAFYFAMISISLAAAIASALLQRRLVRPFGTWNASVLACGAYVAATGLAGFLFPVVDEVPDQFPAVVLWQFRVASAGGQLLMWATIGLLFGALTERSFSGRRAGNIRNARAVRA